jgi:protein gp37
MSAISTIEWTDRTWNPVRGCSVVSPGCVNCYAMKQAHRFSGAGKPYEGLTKQTKAGPQWTGVVRTIEDALLEPLSWRKPSRVFVNSMSDLFHESVPDVFIERVFSVMALAERHTFQVLTKRPARMKAWFDARRFDVKGYAILQTEQAGECLYAHPWPLPNVWLGVSCENQQTVDERIPLLLQTPAAVRWVSAEPLLGPMLLDQGEYSWLTCHQRCTPDRDDPCVSFMNSRECFHGIDWVVVGGESGPGARPFDLAWARSIVQQCKAADVPVFVKQLGAVPVLDEQQWRDGDGLPAGHVRMLSATNHRRCPDGKVPLSLSDRKGGAPSEWPEDLRIRQFPRVEVPA